MIIQYYFNLIKPGIIIGNILSSIGGFLLASHTEPINYLILINMIIGLSLIIASSCVFNNIIDRDIDILMNRTKNRVLAKTGLISIQSSIYYAIILSILGFLLLGYTKNLLTIILTAIGFLIYIYIYSLWMKRKSIYSIAIGSIAGSMPPVIGYCTASNALDVGALILLMIFSFWQIPHSYSITIFRSQDYKLASVPTFSSQKGIKLTKMHILTCIFGFLLTNICLTFLGYTSYIFLFIMLISNLFWLYIGWFNYKLTNDHTTWSKKMFISSIIIIIVFNLSLLLDFILFTNYKK